MVSAYKEPLTKPKQTISLVQGIKSKEKLI